MTILTQTSSTLGSKLGSYPDPGIRLCMIQDNNGNLIEFVTPL
jgi:hypothetical protein